ncbi:hypothetical protein BV20DRAFT_533248 [Pilatotrama ljubarskyi]|nr:hypothetical protein BV20DRAFT_533248 [Pilatotrama ljubarskyi]
MPATWKRQMACHTLAGSSTLAVVVQVMLTLNYRTVLPAPGRAEQGLSLDRLGGHTIHSSAIASIKSSNAPQNRRL